MAKALADVHNIDSEGEASIAHTDIYLNQFISGNGRYKLNDFNRARFLAWSTKDQKPCPYYVGGNEGTFRSPEEYNYEPQTEMVDVYSMGNIFFTFLQGELPFDDLSSKAAIEMVKKGRRPRIYVDLWHSTDPVNQALKHAMIISHKQNAADRATAREIETFLTEKLRELDPDFVESEFA